VDVSRNMSYHLCICVFCFQAEDGIRDFHVTGVQTCALPISARVETQGAAVESSPQLIETAPGVYVTAEREAAPTETEIRRGLMRSEERRVGNEWRWRGPGGEG